ncbi:MAG: phosphoribosylformylglycinamidine synthase subunit PurQ [Candidatus Margulisbacteria bacterium]|nr:phosphoribosylformylglycinamidine synthase subunit PurQ [Candidatus Margulisiibacteriota bacterium]
MNFGIIVFPGSNCDHDCWHVATKLSGNKATFIWHGDDNLPKDFQDPKGANCLIIPGGFSYGDYLRCGAIAKFSPIMKKVIKFGQEGGLIIGICNGFQVLTECGLLPGVLHRNNSLKFICKDIYLKVNTTNTPFTNNCKKGQVLRIPIAHGEGNYFCDDKTLEELEKEERIAFHYCSKEGLVDKNYNPNGSRHNIAGILSKNHNVLGMMPHPERCSEEVLGNTDGKIIFESIIAWAKQKRLSKVPQYS